MRLLMSFKSFLVEIKKAHHLFSGVGLEIKVTGKSEFAEMHWRRNKSLQIMV
jgi:hypothetical protein